MGGLLTQFCIAGLQHSSAEEPKMHQKNSCRLGLTPYPTKEAPSAPTNLLVVGRGCKPPLQKPGSLGSNLWPSSFGPLGLASPPQC